MKQKHSGEHNSISLTSRYLLTRSYARHIALYGLTSTLFFAAIYLRGDILSNNTLGRGMALQVLLVLLVSWMLWTSYILWRCVNIFFTAPQTPRKYWQAGHMRLSQRKAIEQKSLHLGDDGELIADEDSEVALRSAEQ
jgi:hypothetical protein